VKENKAKSLEPREGDMEVKLESMRHVFVGSGHPVCEISQAA